jgi:hypothetical protein
MLEKIRTANKEKKAYREKLSEDTFIIPDFKPLIQDKHSEPDGLSYKVHRSPIVDEKRKDRNITRNHYANCIEDVEINLMKEWKVHFAEARLQNRE